MEITATDAVIRALEDARARTHSSKAELARRMGVKPEIVRRLLPPRAVTRRFAFSIPMITTTLGPPRPRRSVR